MPEGRVAERADWVRRVLGIEVAAAPTGVVGFAKLQLRWRSAQQRAADSLEALGAALLAMGEVQDDPRFPLVVQAVKSLPRLVPDFGEQLADQLDEAGNLGGEPGKAHLRQAITTVGAYRQQLAAVPTLLQLAQFGRQSVGVEVSAYQELDTALAEIEREVSARAA